MKTVFIRKHHFHHELKAYPPELVKRGPGCTATIRSNDRKEIKCGNLSGNQQSEHISHNKKGSASS
jgi:hypothetical protein